MDEERHHCFLREEPRMAEGARDDIREHDDAEAGDTNAAQNHQETFEGIEYAPFEVAPFVQDQVVKAHRSFPELQPESGRREADELPACPADYCMLRTSPRTFTA